MVKNINTQKLILDYNKYKSSSKASILNGLSPTAGYKHLKFMGIIKDRVINTCIDDFFSVDSPESFYWAGFIAADGNLFIKEEKYKQLRIELSNIDDEHLKKFKECVGFSGNITYNTKRHSCEITIISDKMFDDLGRFNVIPKKSLIYEFPKWMLKHKFINHFIRGMVDGDGSFYYKISTGRTIHQLSFNIVGTKSVVNAIKDTFCKKINLSNNKKITKKRGSTTYCLAYSGNDCVAKIRQFLYSNSSDSCRLYRKYNSIVRNETYKMALDLSLNSTGFCVMSGDQIVDDGYGIIKSKSGGFEGPKLLLTYKSIKALIRRYRPSEIIIESIFKGKNINTFKSLSMVHGVIYKLLFEEGFEDKIVKIGATKARGLLGIKNSKEDAFDLVYKKYSMYNFRFNDHNDISDSIILLLARNEMEKRGLSEKDLRKKKKRKRKRKKQSNK